MLPRVSTAIIFLTKTFILDKFKAAIPKDTVTVAGNPSGTLATISPIANSKFVIALYPMINPKQKKITPTIVLQIATHLINICNSIYKGDSTAPAVDAKLAIYP